MGNQSLSRKYVSHILLVTYNITEIPHFYTTSLCKNPKNFLRNNLINYCGKNRSVWDFWRTESESEGELTQRLTAYKHIYFTYITSYTLHISRLKDCQNNNLPGCCLQPYAQHILKLAQDSGRLWIINEIIMGKSMLSQISMNPLMSHIKGCLKGYRLKTWTKSMISHQLYSDVSML